LLGYAENLNYLQSLLGYEKRHDDMEEKGEEWERNIEERRERNKDMKGNGELNNGNEEIVSTWRGRKDHRTDRRFGHNNPERRDGNKDRELKKNKECFFHCL
jgi:hypothetical protein